MSASTTYTVATSAGLIGTRSSKASAIKMAEDARGELEVVVTTAKGTVVHTVRPLRERAKPFTRTEQATFEVPAVKGFTVAYTRRRIQTAVLRADDRSGYLVLHVPTGVRTEAANTTEARELTNKLAEVHAEERAARLAQEKADKQAARDAKRAAKEAEAAEAEQPAELVEA